MRFHPNDEEPDKPAFEGKVLTLKRISRQRYLLSRRAKPPAEHLVLKPQEYEGRSLHIISADLDLSEAFARCLVCRKDLKVICFPSAEKPGYLATRRNFVLEARCYICKEREQKTALSAHPGYTPELDDYWHKNFVTLCGGARARNLLVSIDKDALIERYLRNEGRCEVTGVLLKIERSKRNRLAPSVDRIDSASHYSPCNIQIVARCVNLMKGDLTTEEFYEWCKRISDRKA